MGKVRPKDLENGQANLPANRYYGTNWSWELWFHLVPWASESTWEATFKYGENIQAGRLVFFWDGSFKERHRIGADVFNGDDMRTTVAFWSAATTLRYRVWFDMPENYEYLSSIVVPITKTGTGHGANHRVQARIVTTGWDLIKGSNKINWASAKMQNGQIVFNFDNVKLTPWTFYWIELICNSNDGTNYFNLSLSWDWTWARWNELNKYGYWTYDGSLWNQSDDYRVVCMRVNFSIKTEQGSVYECNSSMIDTCIPDGITSETKSEWESWKVMVVWVSTAFSNLATGNRYKLNSNLVTWMRWSRADMRFWYSTAEQRVAQLFTCDFTKPISKMFLHLYCSNRTIANKLVVKIVEVDQTTGFPSETLADNNAIAKIDFVDFKNAVWQPIIVKFPAQFNLELNKKYYIVLEIEWTFSTSGYMQVRYDNSTWDGNFYRYETSDWVQKASSSLAYTFIHWDDILNLEGTLTWRNGNNSNKRFIEVWNTNSRKSAFRFMVSMPTRIKALTWNYENVGTPITDMKIRIESNKLLDNKANDNGLRYEWTGGSDYNTPFGSSEVMKMAMRFSPTETQDVKTLWLQLQKTWAPTDKVTVRIETDNDSKPSGTLVSEHATSTMGQSLAAHTNRYYTAFEFDENVTLTRWQTYWIVLSKENDEVSSSAYYNAYCKNNWTFTWWEVWYSANGTEWTRRETWTVRMLFYFNNSYNESIDVPSGTLVSAGAKATFASTSHQSWMHYATLQFDQEVSLIPNTIYWLVFENFNPIVDTSNYYRIYACDTGNWLMNANNTTPNMTMAYLTVQLSQDMKWIAEDDGQYPRFRFDAIQEDDGWSIDIIPWEFSGKDITAISSTAWMLTTWEAGNVYKGSLLSNGNNWNSRYVFRAPRDGQIIFLKDLAWTVRSYVYWNDYTPYSTQTWSLAGSVNIEKGKLYQIENGTTSVQDFIISLQ